MRKKSFIFCLILVLFLSSLPIDFSYGQNKIAELEKEIQKRKEKIEELERQKKVYQENIKAKQKEILTLKNQISILEDRIAQTKIEISLKERQIEKVNLEIEKIKNEIRKREGEIKNRKGRLKEIIRLIYLYGKKDYLRIFLLNKSLADFYNSFKYSEDLQASLQKALNRVQLIKQALETQKAELENKKIELQKLKEELENKRKRLEEEEELKSILLKQTRGEEKKFQALLIEAKREYEQITQEITYLERKIREELARERRLKLKGGLSGLIWPLDYRPHVTVYFRDPDYIFRRWIGEHTGIDLRAKQGTPVYASESGYVAKVKKPAPGNLSYIMIIHNEAVTTLYLHLSQVFVEEGTYVSKGQMIGLTGGLPGTPGAGRFTTGPHLHFEIRVNGIPVNPLDYLP